MATEPEKAAAKPAAKKAPVKKPAAKRGPTKAAALKALGLTQADLDTLKSVAAERAAAQAENYIQPGDLDVAPAPPVPDPEIIQNITRDAIAAKHSEPFGKVGSQFYARNLRAMEAAIRLDRQHDKGQKRLEFKPRGERGDIVALKTEDLEDPTLLANVGVIIEIITAAEAREIISKQSTNQQAAVHPVMALLRNELDQPYAEGAVKVEPEYNSQGIVVANLKPQGGGAGELASSGRGIDWAAVRSGDTGQTAPGGNPAIISDGFARPDIAADAVARSKSLEGPAAGGITQVTVAPVEKS